MRAMPRQKVTEKLNRQMDFELLAHGSDSVTVETTGLDKFDRLNLQISDISRPLAPVARRLMAEVAAYCVAVKEVGHDETVGVPCEFGHNVVRAIEAESALGKRTGLFRRKQTVLRLIPPQPGPAPETPPLLALATEILNHAHQQAQAGNIEEAVHAAAWSIDIYPGEPGIEARQPAYNMENYRAYEMLFSILGKREYLDKALARSVDFQFETLGLPVRALSHLPDPEEMKVLVDAVRQIALRMYEKLHKSDAKEPHATMASPIIMADNGVLQGFICIVPKEYAELYYEGDARKFVDDERTPLLIAEAAHAGQRDPGRLAHLTWVTRTDWQSTQNQTHELEGLPCLGPEFLMSALLSEVGRCGAAGCSWDEVRAHFGLDTNEGREASANNKLEALTERANGWLNKVIRRHIN